MLRVALIRLSFLWLLLTVLLSISLLIAPYIPSKGTLLLTHNVFLNEYDRFEFYDTSRGVFYGFTPSLSEDVVSASFAPNGRYLAFIDLNNGRASLNITTLSGQVLTETINVERLSLGAWSRNSRYFVQEDGASTIFIFDIEASTINPVSILDEGLSMPSWSENSEQITFIGSHDDEYQIWLVDADGSNLRQVMSTNHIIHCPIFSPDNETMAYFQRADNGNQLHYIHLDGSSNDSYHSGRWRTTKCPLWSSNERYITFMAFLTEEYTTDIVLLDTLTGEARAILEVDPTTNIQWWR